MKKIILFINMIFVAFLLLSCTTSCSRNKFADYIECSKIYVPGKLNNMSGGTIRQVYEFYCEDADYEKIYSFSSSNEIIRNNYRYLYSDYVGDIYTWKVSIYYNEKTKNACIVSEQYINKTLDDSIYSYIQFHPVFEHNVPDADFKRYDALKPNYAYREEHFNLSDYEDIVYEPIN